VLEDSVALQTCTLFLSVTSREHNFSLASFAFWTGILAFIKQERERSGGTGYVQAVVHYLADQALRVQLAKSPFSISIIQEDHQYRIKYIYWRYDELEIRTALSGGTGAHYRYSKRMRAPILRSLRLIGWGFGRLNISLKN
jgi:hypothetical protein